MRFALFLAVLVSASTPGFAAERGGVFEQLTAEDLRRLTGVLFLTNGCDERLAAPPGDGVDYMRKIFISASMVAGFANVGLGSPEKFASDARLLKLASVANCDFAKAWIEMAGGKKRAENCDGLVSGMEARHSALRSALGDLVGARILTGREAMLAIRVVEWPDLRRVLLGACASEE